MKPSKIIHSFWTRPLENRMYGVDRLDHMIGDIWFFALSLAYAQRAGFEVELHTDTLGRTLLGHLPYNAIHLTLDDIPAEVNPRFWAAGKMWALAAADPHAVHIDGDVFLKNPELIEVQEDADFIVQNTENHCRNYWQMAESVPGWTEFCLERGFKKDWKYDYNTGVLGIFNPTLRRDFLMAYKEFAIAASNQFAEVLRSNEWLTPDLFAEQCLFYAMAHDGYNEAQVIPNDWDGQPMREYQHILTSQKYNVIEKVRRTLEVFFPEIYQTTKKLCQNI